MKPNSLQEPNTNAMDTDNIIQLPRFEINIKTKYLAGQSVPDEKQFVFSYTISILNKGNHKAQLLRRHWIITDADGETMEIKGVGVVGEQPWIAPGEEFQYTSGTVLNEVMGCMHGSYTMCGEDGVEFEAQIPVFTLSLPDMLH